MAQGQCKAAGGEGEKESGEMTRARQIWKLRHRITRLIARLKQMGGEGMTMRWMRLTGRLMDEYAKADALGIAETAPMEEWK